MSTTNTPAAVATASPLPPGVTLGDWYVIRDHMAGVYCGRLVALDMAAGTWSATEARQAHYWIGAAATPGLAVRGPSGGRIGPACPAHGRSLVSIIAATPEAVAAWQVQPVWSP